MKKCVCVYKKTKSEGKGEDERKGKVTKPILSYFVIES